MSGIQNGLIGSMTKKTYAIGDIGPSGVGKVIYDAGSVQSWGRYIEAAEPYTDAGQRVWSGQQFVSCGASGTAIGTGKSNTAAIIAQSNTANCAATICTAFNGGGFTDWFLPSRDEMTQWYNQKSYFTSVNTGREYWTSSETASDGGYAIYMVTGGISVKGKSSGYLSRPMRYFS